MKSLILFTIVLTYTNARVVENYDEDSCNGVIVNGINHEKQVLKDHVDKPYQLAMDYDTNKLFFSYTSNDGRVFISCYLNLKTNEFETIDGVRGGFANSVDPTTHKIYIGGTDGIYELNENSKEAIKTDITNKNIWQVFYKNNLYFSTYPNEEAYVYKNGETKRVSEIGEARAMLLALDKNDNIFYYNSSGLFYYDKTNGKTKDLGYYTVNGFTVDSNQNLYFSTPVGVYSISYNNVPEVHKMVSINNIYGAAIDADGSIIYAAEDSIIKLKSTGHECYTELKAIRHI